MCINIALLLLNSKARLFIFCVDYFEVFHCQHFSQKCAIVIHRLIMVLCTDLRNKIVVIQADVIEIDHDHAEKGVKNAVLFIIF